VPVCPVVACGGPGHPRVPRAQSDFRDAGLVVNCFESGTFLCERWRDYIF
jgi:hypothetical protein